MRPDDSAAKVASSDDTLAAEARAQTGGSRAIVAVGGVGLLRFHTQRRPDRFISESLIRGEEWEPFESLLFRRCVSPGAFVCDVGANLGWYSVIAAKLGASVLAIEPDPETFSLLQANVALNSCDLVSAECVALSDHAGVGHLALSPTNQGDHRLIVGDSYEERSLIEVPLRCLDELVGGRSIDVLKMDTQGAEVAILRGASGVLEAGVGALFIEFWPMGLRLAGADTRDLLEILEITPGQLFEIDSDNRQLLRTSTEEMTERARAGRFSADGGDHLDLLLLSPEVTERFGDLISDRPNRRPLADELDPEERRRVELTVACDDADDITKVADAGLVREQGDVRIQVMHNGVKVLAGGYYGSWMTEVIARLRGHYEPQEERVFHEVIQQLVRDEDLGANPSIVELGAFWSYYALWFLNQFPNGEAVLVEPDPAHLAVASANLGLNDRQATLIQAAIGAPEVEVAFDCEDGTRVQVERVTLVDVLDRASVERVDVVVSDIQGFETEMLEAACGALAERVRFLIVSTHHQSISGRWDTHQRCLSIIRQCGGHVFAEHTVDESFSGDGLIAASFDPRDRDLRVDLSMARSGTALFAHADAATDELTRHVTNLERSLAIAVEYAMSLEVNRAVMEASIAAATDYARSLEAELDKQVQQPD